MWIFLCNAGFNKQRTMNDVSLKSGEVGVPASIYTFRELAAATQNFNQEMLIGEGCFGRVYKGQLKHNNQVSETLSYLHLCLCFKVQNGLILCSMCPSDCCNKTT